MSKDSQRLLIVFLIALSLRLILFFAVGPWRQSVVEERILPGDPAGYHQVALNVAEHGRFSSSASPPFQPNVFMTPAYPLFLVAVYKVFGNHVWIAILVQIMLGSAICLIVYKIGRLVFNEQVAFLSGLLMAGEYASLSHAMRLFTETLFTFFFVGHVYFLVKFLKDGKSPRLAYSALLLGLATLTRPVSAYFFLPLFVFFFVRFRHNWRKGISSVAIFSLIFVLTLVPWMTRNYIVSGNFLISSAQKDVFGWAFINLNRRLKESQEKAPEMVGDIDPGSTAVDQEAISRKEIVMAIGRDIKRYLFGMARFMLTPGSSTYPRLLGLPYQELDNPILKQKYGQMLGSAVRNKTWFEIVMFIYGIVFLLVLYFAMVPGIFAASRETRYLGMLFVVIIIYFALAAGSFTTTERYRIPIMPFVILLASSGIIYIQKGLKKRKKRLSETAVTG